MTSIRCGFQKGDSVRSTTDQFAMHSVHPAIQIIFSIGSKLLLLLPLIPAFLFLRLSPALANDCTFEPDGFNVDEYKNGWIEKFHLETKWSHLTCSHTKCSGIVKFCRTKSYILEVGCRLKKQDITFQYCIWNRPTASQPHIAIRAKNNRNIWLWIDHELDSLYLARDMYRKELGLGTCSNDEDIIKFLDIDCRDTK